MDLGLPPDQDSVSEGFKCLEKLLELDPSAKVIVLTGQNGPSLLGLGLIMAGVAVLQLYAD